MTTTTVDPATKARPARRAPARFLVAFLVGLLAALALGAGGLYAFDRSYDGRVLPGVRVGSVDLSGLAPSVAHGRLTAAYAAAGDGELVLTAGTRQVVIPYADLDRRVDVDAVLAQALAAGRAGGPVERAIEAPKTALRGVAFEPSILFDADELAARIEAAAAELDVEAMSASVTVTAEGITLKKGVDGAKADREAPLAEALAALAPLDAPARVEVTIPVLTEEPAITTAEAEAGKAAAERMAQDIDVTVGEEKLTIQASTIRTWLRVAATVDGRAVPVLDVTKSPPLLAEFAAKVKQDPKNASFLMSNTNQVVGATAGREGRALNVKATAALLHGALNARAGDTPTPAVEAAVTVVKPALTTEEAKQAAPLMKRISTWKTYFPISEKNFFGANIWIPAKEIDGSVVAPGEWFDFWKAIGPVTRARGYGDGGAIINGRTEPTGALAGGICSCSTTLFNAALRAGLQMGKRKNHYYYIDRYPIGLDATVFKSGNTVQTMTFRNDTEHPLLIRGFRIRDGSAGYVRFDLYSVPTGRQVSFSRPTIKNVRQASDSVEYTTTIPAGTRKRIESPTDGKDVWVTRTVKDANGKVIHKETYYSHYARITGVVLIGRAAE